jgi:hypothetical protein
MTPDRPAPDAPDPPMPPVTVTVTVTVTGRQLEEYCREYSRHRRLAAVHAHLAAHALPDFRRPARPGILAVSLLDRLPALGANLAEAAPGEGVTDHV